MTVTNRPKLAGVFRERRVRGRNCCGDNYIRQRVWCILGVDQGRQRPVTNERKHITQPTDWWEAFKAEADKQGVSLAEWLGEAGKAQLPNRIAAKLSERPPANRPKKASAHGDDLTN